MAILLTSDFVGKYRVSQDQYNTVITQSYIDKYVPYYLAKVFGATMSAELIADIDDGSAPTDPLLLAVFEPFTLDATDPFCCMYEYFGVCDKVVISNGVKEMLLGFIYWHIMADKRVTADPIGGTSRPQTEMSSVSMLPESQVYERYNEAVTTARSIQYKCRMNSEDYPDFNGTYISYNYVL